MWLAVLIVIMFKLNMCVSTQCIEFKKLEINSIQCRESQFSKQYDCNGSYVLSLSEATNSQ
jgi:hypothetical protein